MADALAIPKSSLTQLLKNLTGRGYVAFVPEGRGYRLGGAIVALSRNVGGAQDLVAVVQPLLTELTRHTRESSALNQARGDAAEVTATVLGPARLVTHMRLGDMAPLYATSGGKAIRTDIIVTSVPARARGEPPPPLPAAPSVTAPPALIAAATMGQDRWDCPGREARLPTALPDPHRFRQQSPQATSRTSRR